MSKIYLGTFLLRIMFIFNSSLNKHIRIYLKFTSINQFLLIKNQEKSLVSLMTLTTGKLGHHGKANGGETELTRGVQEIA